MAGHIVVAVIGLGSMGQRYVSHFRNQEKTTVVGCDTRSETFPEGISCVETVSELLDTTTPSIAVISLPAEHHLDTLFALQDHHPSCSVLMEKPVSDQMLSEDEFKQCQALFSSTISVGYCWRFHPYVRQLYAKRRNIRHVAFYVGSDMRTWPGNHYTDPLREFSHELDLVTHLTTTQIINDVSFTPSGIYCIDGIHRLGTWSVRIAPFTSPAERFVEVTMSDNSVINHSWDVRPRTIEAMYRDQALQLTHANGPEGLSCSLRDGIQTTLLVDEIESRLSINDTAWRIM
jgi:predicted dehydrogenase